MTNFLGWSKSKTLENNQVKVGKTAEFVPDIVENNVGKGENAGYQHFLLFPHCFQHICFLRVVKMWDYLVKGLALKYSMSFQF